ncbi:nuclear transport factor 2 family protein [Nonomuraea sp. NPDC059023]|uniref:nuclear transport factor 2 family protein n=1 Tax=unclassified Nonomuraea TaxID=2593643 RepID=UPI0036928F59
MTKNVIDGFNAAFRTHDPSGLPALVADDCALENVDGAAYTGPGEALRFWSALAEDESLTWTVEDVSVLGDEAVIRWRFASGGAVTRGLNLMRLRDGLIAEATGYLKVGMG